MAAPAIKELGALPVAPDVPMGLVERLHHVRKFDSGLGVIGAAGGPVTTVRVGPRGLVPPFVVVTSPQGAHDVLAASDGAFDKEMIVHVQNRVLGDNVFNLAHARWLARRRTLQPIFTKKHVVAFAGHMAAAAQAHADDMSQRGQVDLDQEMRHLTLEVVGKSVFGLDLGKDARAMGPHVRRVLQWVTNRSLRPVRSPMWLPTPARFRMRHSMAVLHALVDSAIDAAVAQPDGDAELVRLLLDATDPETGKPLTRKAVRAELLVFMLAGHDTTATTLAYSLWALGRHPDVQERLVAEVAALGDRTLTVGDVPSLPFTVQVIHEALRMCPPAPAIGRMAMRDVAVDGFRIPAGTNVVVGAYAIQHDARYWDEPERFDPDRFSVEQSAGRSRWQFFPFGAGPRSCIGDHFAMLEATLALATVVRAADIESLDDVFPTALPFTMTAGGPIPARVRKRVNRTG
ncbi:cytochrome P450 [Nocardioides sp. WS12]|uniref:cytochrome P450 n=1 Tax=Nocardioides sp. WS12 TaxID=2486272 RepID=UPI00191D2220|nr:cytochrome P450 [Nocardioides sp. WS12]